MANDLKFELKDDKKTNKNIYLVSPTDPKSNERNMYRMFKKNLLK